VNKPVWLLYKLLKAYILFTNHPVRETLDEYHKTEAAFLAAWSGKC
jgi:hypothetical protein